MIVVLSNSNLQLETYPEHGFVISSIRHKKDPRNLLWNPPTATFQALSKTYLGPSGSESIDTFDQNLLTGGWFPMFPTAGLPGDMPNRWMHGEAPRLAWDITDQKNGRVTCSMRTPSSGFAITRMVSLEGDKVRVQTTAVNNSGTVQNVSFGEHPCFSRDFFAGGVIAANPFRASVTSHGDPLRDSLVEFASFSWPNAPTVGGGMADLSAIPEFANGRQCHVLLESPGSVSIRNSTVTVTASWDEEALPYALLWQKFEPATGPESADVFAIEPSSSPGRTMSEAAEAGKVTAVAPGETISFWMSLQIDFGETGDRFGA